MIVDATPLDAVIVGRVMLDDVTFADGTRITAQLGGAGTFAAIGAALVAAATTGPVRSVGVVSGVGADLDRASFRAFGVDTDGLSVRDPYTPRNSVVYRPDGERDESPVFGFEHFATMAPTATPIPDSYRYPLVSYLFGGTDAHELAAVMALCDHAKQTARGGALVWEIDAALCVPARRADVSAVLANTDILSINLTEARHLCATTDVAECVAELQALGVRRGVLRMGSAGSVVFTDDSSPVSRVGVGVGPVVDPTGAGNAFSGALAVGWINSGDLVRAAQLATAAATLTISQYGPPRAEATICDLVDRVPVDEFSSLSTRSTPARDDPHHESHL